ncbi:Fpg/Nei family DNA glycosylase [Sandaracinus amylolyticus]|uniref:DNA-(apurinic or apyrimidinic site) lyase n=1 Tax=Sandaracinus amylolyticus TaxID=927083 RepID=A0A0F6W4N6_9BACT|nr:DNA-formamidopyrimidine glycosylase family protein [Sandaracinus amylolyticus]AKF07381.1 Formamidopyrimidine-DNA glycosylase [Sandaracinus amylolyticus]
MPEGDTLHRTALRLRPLLAGRLVRALDLPRRGERVTSVIGKRVESVEARGKNLLISFDDGLVLHTHMKMNGVWRGYGPGERVPGVSGNVVVVLEVDGAIAMCWSAPIVRLIRASDVDRDPHLAGLGPDPIATSFDPDEAMRRLRALDHAPLGVALMDQRAIAGIGNVWKSELLFEHRLDPFAPVARFGDDELRALLATAERRMRGGFARGTRPQRVYGRQGEPCPRCAHAITMERQGDMRRSTYWCARCQPPRVEAPA